MFERPHHLRVAYVLGTLDATRLLAHDCLFGGGTAMALRYGEYRESVDIDFLVSSLPGYRALRQLLTGPDGVRPLLREGQSLQQSREVRADQYGIRTLVQVEGVDIKLEIVNEGRIVLQPPGPEDRVCGVATLTPLDMAASKLLANADRWRDDSVRSRDLIDLAMMAPPKPLLVQALDKAHAAYGDAVRRDLLRAVAGLRERPGRLAECMQAMRMTTVSPALLWQRIRHLERRAQ